MFTIKAQVSLALYTHAGMQSDQIHCWKRLSPFSMHERRRQGLVCMKDVVKVYTTFTNFSMKYLVMCKVYIDVGGIK